MELRRWQKEALPVCLQSLADNRRGVVQAVTASGKSVLIAEMIRVLLQQDPLQNIILTTPSVQLVEQLAADVRPFVGADRVGTFYTKSKQWDRAVTIACLPSVAALAEKFAAKGKTAHVWVADELHRTEARSEDYDSDDEAVTALRPLRRIGFTATPFLSGGGKISTFSEVIYRYTAADALRDGTIVPWRVVGCEGWSADDATDDAFEIDSACYRLIYDHTSGPGVVDAESIKDAEEYAEFLNQRGITAAAVHSRTKDRDEVMRRLERGELRAVVHVNVLVEGTNHPFLRWGCFRRDVGSRVRFIQQLGRFVRTYPGKSEAVILDPHDLFGRHRLAPEAALGFDPPPPPPSPDEILLGESTAIKNAPTPEQKYAAQTASLGRYVRELYQALAIEGAAMPARKVAAGPWRKEPVSDAQVAGLARMVPIGRRLPPDHAVTLKRIVAVPDLVTKGIAGDMRDTLVTLSKRPTPFVPAIPIAIPPESAFEPPVIRTLHVAVVLSRTHAGGVILRGREVVWSTARERAETDNFMVMSGRTIDYAVRKMRETDQEIVGSHNGVVVQAIRRHPRVNFRVVPEKENPAVARCWKLMGGMKGRAPKMIATPFGRIAAGSLRFVGRVTVPWRGTPRAA